MEVMWNMKKFTALILALSCMSGVFSLSVAAEENNADAYVIFSDPIESKNMKFFDGGQDDPYALTYNEKVVLDGEQARKVYGYSPTVNYVYLRMDESFYNKETDHDFFIDLRFYQFGPGAATFRLQYSSLSGVKTITIRKEAEPMWVTKRLHIDDANFNHSIDDVGADIKIVSGAFNAFAFIHVTTAASVRNNIEFDVGAAPSEHAKSMYDMGLYVPDGDDYEKDLQSNLTKAKAADMIVKIIGKEDELSGYSTSMTGASEDEGRALGYLEKNNYIDWSGDARSSLTQEELVKVFAKIQGISESGDLFDNAISTGLIKPSDLILQPGKLATLNNLLCLGYNWLLLGDDSGEQNANSLVAKNLISDDAFDKYCYYEKYIDDYSGLPVEYFDMGTDGVERMYFTKTYWLKDGDAFIVSDWAEARLYKYTLATHKVEALHGAEFKSNDAALTQDNLLYIWNQSSSASDRIFYSLDLNEPNYDEISAEVNADGTAFEGDLTLNRSKGVYDKNIGFSGEDGLSQAEGKPYSYNVPAENNPSGKWGNSWYFGIPDSFLYGANPEKVEIEVEYYAPDGTGKLYITVNDDNSKYSAPVVPGKWTKKVFTIKKDDGKFSTFCNGYDGISDFKLMFENCQAYVRKVSVRKYKNNIKNLGPRPSGYLIHTTKDGKFVSVNCDHGTAHTFELYDAENGTWYGELFEGDFVGPGRDTDHVMINPVYSNLILFCHDGVDVDGVNLDLDRLWLHDTKTGSYKNIYKQRTNIKNIQTGEKIGHENWSADGESIVAVKYRETPNIGRSGIFRVNRFGEDAEYLNDDYDYWHCNPSPDGRWIVADTKVDSAGRGRIVIIDSKTGDSHVVAYPRIRWGDPWEPHAQFSSDGKKVTFATIRRQINGNDVLGAAIVDVSSIVENGQADDVYEGTNGRKGFRISPYEINFAGAKSNEVTTHIKNLDGNKKRLFLIVTVYDENGNLISVDSSRCNTSSDTTLKTTFDWPDGSKTLKCFMFDGEGNPVNAYPTAVEKLRAARTGMHNVVLSWTPSNNLIDSKYEIYKNGIKIGETTDTIYRDANLDDGTVCTYEVKPVFDENAYLSEYDSRVTLTPVYVDGKLTAVQSPIPAPKAQVKVKTDNKTVSCNLGTGAENGLRLWLNESDNTSDNYTEITNKNGTPCRQNIYRTINGTRKPSMFYFRIDKNLISRRVRDVDITVKYYDYARGGGEIYLDYNADNSANNTVRIASVGSNASHGKWKTAKIKLSDVYFDTYQSLSRCDFRLRPTSGEVCISEVSVTNNYDEPTSDDQYVQWNTEHQSGLRLIGGGKEENGLRYIGNSGEWLKFDVDNSYQHGTDMNMALIDISYLDKGTGEIYFEYNTSDPTATSDQKSHKPAEVITCEDTGEIKTKRISLIDVDFSGIDGYDFRIGTNSNAYISNVKVLGY